VIVEPKLYSPSPLTVPPIVDAVNESTLLAELTYSTTVTLTFLTSQTAYKLIFAVGS